VVVSIIKHSFHLALVLFLFSAFTDFLDGYIARKFNSISNLGILLDPVADKLLTSSTLISLAYVKLCDPYSVIAIVGREEAVTGIRAIAASKGIVIPASAGGKFKTFLIMASITLLLSGFKSAGEVLLVISALVAVFTGLFYFYKLLNILRSE
jgi:CDP-diacylglycerol--glycerol-3-phosphate 3-phosphatidyltransferase